MIDVKKCIFGFDVKKILPESRKVMHNYFYENYKCTLIWSIATFNSICDVP